MLTMTYRMMLGTVAVAPLAAGCADRVNAFDDAQGEGTGGGEVPIPDPPQPPPTPEPPDDEPPPEDPPEEEPPELDPGCEDGVVEAGEWCLLGAIASDAGYDPCALSVGDIDGDGHMDAAVPNSDFNHVVFDGNMASVLWGDGTGELFVENFPAGGEVPVAIALGDFDRNGKLDLVVSSLYDDEIAILLNNGGRRFAAPIQLSVASGPSRLAAGDFDLNGVDDVAVCADTDDLVSVVLSDGESYRPPDNYAAGLSINDIAIRDIGLDGLLDLVVTNSGEQNVSVLAGRVDGTFRNPIDVALPAYPITVDIADINRDGWLDFVVGTDTPASIVSVFGGPGGFVTGPQTELDASPYEIVIGDLDNDAWSDVAFVTQATQRLLLLEGDGSGVFAEVGTRATGPRPSGVAAADFNEDGVLDVAVSNQDGSSVGLYLSSP